MSEGAPTAVVQRVIGAPPEVVYDEWLDEAALLEFMAPEDSPAREVECDPRVGGRLRIVLVGEDSVVQTSGEYLELDRPNRLSFSVPNICTSLPCNSSDIVNGTTLCVCHGQNGSFSFVNIDNHLFNSRCAIHATTGYQD